MAKNIENDPRFTFIDTAVYERSHNKAPRGFGLWIFSLIRPGDAGYLDADKVFQFSGQYGEAKRAAKQRFAQHGHAYLCD